MSYLKVSIIILNWNGLKDTIECLESLKKITYPNYKVIVVDNGSKGNDADILEKRYKNYIKLIRNKENLGFAEGNNVAIREVIKEGKSDYILCLNNDTVIADPDYLEKLVTIARGNPSCGVLGSLVLNYIDNKVQSEWFAFSKWRGRFLPIHRNEAREKITRELRFLRNNEYLNFSSVLIKPNIFNTVGLFPEDLFLYFEDNIWEDRIRNTNLNIAICYTPETFILHKGASSTGGYKKSVVLDYYDSRNFLYFIKKYYPLWLPYEILMSTVNKIMPKILRGEWVRLKYVLLGLGDFFKGKMGKFQN